MIVQPFHPLQEVPDAKPTSSLAAMTFVVSADGMLSLGGTSTIGVATTDSGCEGVDKAAEEPTAFGSMTAGAEDNSEGKGGGSAIKLCSSIFFQYKSLSPSPMYILLYANESWLVKKAHKKRGRVRKQQRTAVVRQNRLSVSPHSGLGTFSAVVLAVKARSRGILFVAALFFLSSLQISWCSDRGG
jgi:hypothetical protein